MKNATKPSIATKTHNASATALLLVIFLGLTGCALPPPAPRPAVYDFGPGDLSAAPASPANRTLPLSPLIVGELDAIPALDSTEVLYRLAYTNAQQLRPYALARWSMPPAQLLRQRLRERIGAHRTLLNPGESVALRAPAAPSTPLTLRIELEEFSQLFETPEKSSGLLRLRASVTQASGTGDKLLAQRSFNLQRPALSADASGGVRALTEASDAVVYDIESWLETLGL
jgi:cholesterol transport system auxiliary component